jgi:hypothetical protein
MKRPISILWAAHFDERFAERTFGISLFAFSMFAEDELALGRFEVWWEHDERHDRGERKNLLVKATDDAWVLFRQDERHSQLFHACTVLTQRQYTFNSNNLWHRSVEGVRKEREAGLKGLSLVRSLTHSPFEKLKKAKR